MTEDEMILQIKDLISDRKSFISSDKDTSEIFKKDVEALEMILDKYDLLTDANLKAIRKIDKFKESYIICFDKPLWNFVKGLEKTLKGMNESEL